MSRRPLRVVQWGTGNVGKESLRAILAHPALELAGVFVYNDDKAGADAGELCGMPAAGVRATRDLAGILALHADCAVYMPRHAKLDEVCSLLAAGINVVATPFLFHAQALPAADRARLLAACEQGGSSVHGTGIHPGFVGMLLPLVLSGMTRRVSHLRIQERANWSFYDSPRITFDNMRFGHPPAAAALEANPFARFNSGLFQEQIWLLAEGLGATLERVETSQELVCATQDCEIVGGTVAAGTVSGQRYRWQGIAGGRSAIEIEALWSVGPGYPESWPRPKDGWTLTLEGEPSLRVHLTNAASFERAREVPLAAHIHAADIATAMQAVNAIAPVCEAPPGIATFLGLPLIRNPHAFRPPDELG